MLILLLLLLGAFLLRELSNLTVIVPQAQQMIQTGLTALQDFLLNLANRAPEGLAGMLTQSVLELFSGGAALHIALELAAAPENAGKTIVALLPDSGDRYLSTDLYL